ncbi:hypothetical protein DRP04_02705 [Archaeoglobales archaeon]|nr:MAG: hypothetical protein DRP04_02705 [Archaeoglobales archaeon]
MKRIITENTLNQMSEALEDIRLQIHAIERELSKYGFDLRRGIESYKVSEIKKIINNSKNPHEVKKILLKLVGVQEKLYEELYKFAGLKDLDVDTDTPEGRLLTIKEWLTSGKTTNHTNTPATSKFSEAILKILEIIERYEDSNICADKIVLSLNEIYKRDYDRHRVLKYLLSVCRELRAIEETQLKRAESMPVSSLVETLLSCVRSIDKHRFKSTVRSRLRK